MLSGASSSASMDKREVAPIIAIIEDDEDAGMQLSHALRRSGYRAFLHLDALEALRAMQQGPKPDLILLDLMMPGMDGWSFRVEQRSSPQLKEIPVIVMSGDASAKAAAIDADAYVHKPCPMERLRPLIDRVLSSAERRKLVARGVELERLRSLGMLVSSVAHEVNNPLVYVGGNLELAARECQRLRQHPDEHGVIADILEHHLAAAQEGADRIAGIVRSLLTFARPETSADRADVVRSVQAAISLAMPSLRQKAKVVNRCERMPDVRGSEARLGQVFLNFLINAAQAIPHGSPERELVEVRSRVEGDRVVIEVSDTGVGIAVDAIPQVFEPFFTTHAHEGGTGLGLSISQEILQGYGGSIRLHSKPGQGTTVRVELPMALGTVDEVLKEAPSAATAPQTTPCSVLVVDDEKMVCAFIRNALANHDVRTYTDPRKALDELGDAPIDLVLSDYLMPVLTGAEFYKQLCAKRPELATRFVLMTGAAASEELTRFEASLHNPVLRKPFSPQALEELARRAVAERFVAPGAYRTTAQCYDAAMAMRDVDFGPPRAYVYLYEQGYREIFKIDHEAREETKFQQLGYEKTDLIARDAQGRPVRIGYHWSEQRNTQTANPTQITEDEFEALKAGRDQIDTPEWCQQLVDSKNRASQINAVRQNVRQQLNAIAPACPKCGGGMQIKSGRNGLFWGCLAFPGCKGTSNASAEAKVLWERSINGE